MHHRANYARNRIILAGIAVLAAACSRDKPTKPTTEKPSNTASISTGEAIASAEPAPSASAAPVASVSEKPRENAPRPSWLVSAPQPVVPSALFARGISGPIRDTFDGLLACQVSVSGIGWDVVVPFFGTAGSNLPDVCVDYGNATACLPSDTPSGTVTFPGVTFTKDSQVIIDVRDSDGFGSDHVGKVSLDAGRGFPMDAKTNLMTLVCRGVPRSALANDIKAREAVVERALVAMEKASSTIDLGRPAPNRKVIETAQDAVRELAIYVGVDDASVKSAINRIAAVESNQGARYSEAVDAELAKHPKSEFQSLPSGRVRCHPTKVGVVEVEVGAKALQHNWVAKDLGPLEFRLVSKSGNEFAPAFDDVYVDDKKIEDLSPTIPAKGKVDIELRDSVTNKQPHIIVVREGAKRVYLCTMETP